MEALHTLGDVSMDAISSYLSEFISFVIGAAAGSFLTVKIRNARASGNANAVDQSHAQAGGDVVGRDKVQK